MSKFRQEQDEWLLDKLAKALKEAMEEEEKLRTALRDVLVYCPDFMHGNPKKHYEKMAAEEIDFSARPLVFETFDKIASEFKSNPKT